MEAFDPTIFTEIWIKNNNFRIDEPDLEPELQDMRLLIKEGFYSCDLPGIPFDPNRIPLFSIRQQVFTLETIIEEEPEPEVGDSLVIILG